MFRLLSRGISHSQKPDLTRRRRGEGASRDAHPSVCRVSEAASSSFVALLRFHHIFASLAYQKCFRGAADRRGAPRRRRGA